MHKQIVRYNNIIQLAQRLGLHIGVFDLESTTFRGTDQFGITEVFCFFVSPEGKHATIGSLINPERPISAKAKEITGITDEMVADCETWDHRFATMFTNMAKGECWVAGFNNETFDNLAVMDINARYGKPFSRFEKSFDVRKMHLALSKATSTKGTLIQIAAAYGVYPQGLLHRAEADTVLTVELLDAIITRHGIEAVLAYIESTKKSEQKANDSVSVPAPSKVSKPTKQSQLGSMLLDFMRGRTSTSLADAAFALEVDEKSLSFEIGKAIDARAVNANSFSNAEAQSWLSQRIGALDRELLGQGKLKPIHDALGSSAPPGLIDYIQLRIALLNSGISWASLRPV